MDKSNSFQFQKEKFGELIGLAKGTRKIIEFADAVGVTRVYISQYLNGKLNSPPSPELIKRITENARNNVTYNDLMIAAGYIPKPDSEVNSHLVKNTSLLKSEHPKQLIELMELCKDFSLLKSYEQLVNDNIVVIPILKYIDKDKLLKEDHGNVASYYTFNERMYSEQILLRMNDNSMINANIKEGDTLVINKQDYAENNDIIVIVLEDNTTLVRRFNKINNIVVFSPENPDFKPLAYINSEFKTSGIKIIGKAIELRHDLEYIPF